ncbi:MAG: hypothetical protein WA709_18285 [Stellaceae bacterium]
MRRADERVCGIAHLALPPPRIKSVGAEGSRATLLGIGMATRLQGLGRP